MLKVSSNRQTQIKVVEGGKVVKTISNTTLNYGQELDQLKKMVEIAIRLSPQDPVYLADKLVVNLGKGKDIEIDQQELEQLQAALFKQEVAVGARVSLTVHVQRPVGASTSDKTRATSRGPVRVGNAFSRDRENAENVENKFDNVLRAPSPHAKRHTTPNKNRSLARSRTGTTGGASTASVARSAVKLNDFLREQERERESVTENAEREQETVCREDDDAESVISDITMNTLQCALPNIALDSSMSAQEAVTVTENEPVSTTKEETVTQKSESESEKIAEEKNELKTSPQEQQEEEQQSVLSQPSESQSLTQSQTLANAQTPSRGRRRQSVLSVVSQEEKERIKESIESTWTDVGDDAERTPPREGMLAPFEFFSEEEDEDESEKESDEEENHDGESVCEEELSDIAEEDEEDEENEEEEQQHDEANKENSVAVEEENTAAVGSEDNAESTVAEKENTETTNAAVLSTPPRAHREKEKEREMATPSSTAKPSHSLFSPSRARRATTAAAGVPLSASKTPSKRSSIMSSATMSAQKKSAQPAVSVFPEGCTALESSLRYEQSLRSYENPTTSSAAKMKNRQSTAKKSKAKKEERDKSPLSAFKRKETSSLSLSLSLSEGRPSIGTITQQWEFMRTNFLNNSDEELEWLMVSKKNGAYNYAHRKHEQAEDKYFRSLYETEYFEKKIVPFAGPRGMLPKLVSQLGGFYSPLMQSPKCESLAAQILETHAQLRGALEKETQCHHLIIDPQTHQPYSADCEKTLNLSFFEGFPPRVETLFLQVVRETDRFRIVRKARDLHAIFSNEIHTMQSRLSAARKDGDEALKNMEKWSRRETEVDEYASVMRQQEEKWLASEYTENNEALLAMRRYLPENIAELSVQDLLSAVQQRGGCISLELAQELKANKLLHWLVTHADDIVFANFLTGENKSFFENIEGLDIVEMRALALVLPPKFELDSDGKKNDWRGRFFARLKLLVSQQRREKVKGAWDPAARARSLIELPPLKPEQLRRSVYFFRTKEQSDVKLKQFDDKLALLAKKEKWLENAEREAKEAKEEYDTVLKEMRDPDFIELYGAEKLASVKDIAKTEWTAAEKKRKTLHDEVARLKKSIENAPITREQFLEKENEMAAYLSERGINWNEPGQSPVAIDGAFDAEKVIEKRVKAAAKFMSADEEAAIRKQELVKLKAAKEEVESVPVAESVPAMPSLNTEVVAVCAARSLAVAAEKDAELLNNTQMNADLDSARPKSLNLSRKGSILSHTNPDLLNTLNKMFSSGNSTMASSSASFKSPARSSRRFSVAVTGSAARGGSLFTNAEGKADAEVKRDLTNLKSKSKLLQRMLAQVEAPQVNSAASGAARPAMSFLDQIKARQGGGAAPAAPAGGGLSFLDQLKARAAGGAVANENGAPAPPPRPNPFGAAPAGGAGGGMSFLEQIKARRKDAEVPASAGETAEKAQNAPPAVPPFLAAALAAAAAPPAASATGGMSFLDQIKSRRIE